MARCFTRHGFGCVGFCVRETRNAAGKRQLLAAPVHPALLTAAGVQMDSYPISLLEGAQALRRDDLPTCARCPPPEETTRRSSCGTSVEKRCRLHENRDQRGLTEKLRCLHTGRSGSKRANGRGSATLYSTEGCGGSIFCGAQVTSDRKY